MGCYTRAMPLLAPFRGLVFDPSIAGPLARVTAPPYDVLSDLHRLAYLRASPFSVVHLDLAEGSEDPHDPKSRYARAARLLEAWERRGAVRRAAEPCYYAYEMTVPSADPEAGWSRALRADMAERSVRGVICAMEIEDWGGTVLPHERVIDGPVQDRLALLRATRTHLSPVYGMLDGRDGALDALVRSSASRPASFEATDEDGVRHRMWPVPGAAADLRPSAPDSLLIADGHHRYTTALRYRDERRATDGPGPWDTVMTLVVDAAAEQVPVLAFHRLQLRGEVPSPVGSVMPDLRSMLAALDDDMPTVGTIVADARGGVEYRVRRMAGEPPAVRALHDDLLDGLVEDSLRYVPDAADADAAVRRRDAVAAYLLPPTTPGRVRAVVERGERLPQKSTYFWPKPRTGMVMMPLDRAS